MSLILKVMSGQDLPDLSEYKPFTVLSGLASVTFFTDRADGEPPQSYARVYVQDAVKTAQVPGFCEHEKLIHVPGNAYVMNDGGKTISTFTHPAT